MGTDRSRHRSNEGEHAEPLLAALLLAALLLATGCGMRSTGRDAGDSMTSGSGGAASPASRGEPMPVTVAGIVADPMGHVGRRVRVPAMVRFLSECPPPARGQTAQCVLIGWLTEPDRRSFVASDVADAIALAERGERVSCPEVGSERGCGDWQDGDVSEIVGVVERQVLGGRETDLFWLNAEDVPAP